LITEVACFNCKATCNAGKLLASPGILNSKALTLPKYWVTQIQQQKNNTASSGGSPLNIGKNNNNPITPGRPGNSPINIPNTTLKNKTNNINPTVVMS
jgi:hypothetical protein